MNDINREIPGSGAPKQPSAWKKFTESVSERIAEVFSKKVRRAKAARKDAKNTAKAADIHQDKQVYLNIVEFFNENITFSQQQWDAMKAFPLYNTLSDDQKSRFERMAKTRVTMNGLIDETIKSQGESNAKYIENLTTTNTQKLEKTKKINLENERVTQETHAEHIRKTTAEDSLRVQYAEELAKVTEQYQKIIEGKIEEAKELLKNNDYIATLNKVREAKMLLKDEKGGLRQKMRIALARIVKLYTGVEKDCKEYVDVIMAHYNAALKQLEHRATAGIEYKTKSLAGTLANETMPDGTWKKMYKGNDHQGFLLPGVPYYLTIRQRVYTEDKTFYIVQQSAADKRYALIDDDGNLFTDIGFCAGIVTLPSEKNTKYFYGKIMIQRQKNGSVEYMNFAKPETTSAEAAEIGDNATSSETVTAAVTTADAISGESLRDTAEETVTFDTLVDRTAAVVQHITEMSDDERKSTDFTTYEPLTNLKKEVDLMIAFIEGKGRGKPMSTEFHRAVDRFTKGWSKLQATIDTNPHLFANSFRDNIATLKKFYDVALTDLK